MQTTIKTAYNQLSRATQEQREEFYSSTLAYEQGLVDKMINAWESRDLGSAHTNYRLEAGYIHATKQNEKVTTNTLRHLKDAEEYFNSKLMQAAVKLEGFGFTQEHISMEIDSAELDNNKGLSFTIRGWDSVAKCYAGRVAARLVWVDCYDKQSHYRWIVTLKDGIKATEEVKEVVEEAVEVKGTQTKKEQVMILHATGRTTKEIQELLGGSIGYIRTVIRENR